MTSQCLAKRRMSDIQNLGSYKNRVGKLGLSA